MLADRWHTCFFDLSGQQGLLGQVEGRTADDAAYWLAQATPAWRDAVRVAAIDMCTIYASAVRRMLPGAQLAADLFHVVRLAVKMTGNVRRRVVRGKYGRRGRPGDPEYGIKGLLVRNLEHLSPGQFAKVIAALDGDPAGQEIAAAWIGMVAVRQVASCGERPPAEARLVVARCTAFLQAVRSSGHQHELHVVRGQRGCCLAVRCRTRGTTAAGVTSDGGGLISGLDHPLY